MFTNNQIVKAMMAASTRPAKEFAHAGAVMAKGFNMAAAEDGLTEFIDNEGVLLITRVLQTGSQLTKGKYILLGTAIGLLGGYVIPKIVNGNKKETEEA